MENIELETVRGDDDGWTFEILEDDERKSDLTGSRFDMWIEPKKGEIIKLSTETGEITVSENLGFTMHQPSRISENACRW